MNKVETRKIEMMSLSISQIITILEKLKDKYGDLPVFTSNDYDEYCIEPDDFEVKDAKEKEVDEWNYTQITMKCYPKRVVL